MFIYCAILKGVDVFGVWLFKLEQDLWHTLTENFAKNCWHLPVVWILLKISVSNTSSSLWHRCRHMFFCLQSCPEKFFLQLNPGAFPVQTFQELTFLWPRTHPQVSNLNCFWGVQNAHNNVSILLQQHFSVLGQKQNICLGVQTTTLAEISAFLQWSIQNTSPVHPLWPRYSEVEQAPVSSSDYWHQEHNTTKSKERSHRYNHQCEYMYVVFCKVCDFFSVSKNLAKTETSPGFVGNHQSPIPHGFDSFKTQLKEKKPHWSLPHWCLHDRVLPLREVSSHVTSFLPFKDVSPWTCIAFVRLTAFRFSATRQCQVPPQLGACNFLWSHAWQSLSNQYN